MERAGSLHDPRIGVGLRHGVTALLALSLLLFGAPAAWAQLIIAGWNFPNTSADAVVDVAEPLNAGRTVQGVGVSNITFSNTGSQGPPDKCIWANGWDGGNGTKYWVIEIATTGFHNLELSSKQRSSNTGPRNFKAQYRIGAMGTWTDIPSATVTTANDFTFTAGVLESVPLPVACEDQPSLFIRWIMTSNTSVNDGTVASEGSSRIDDIYIVANQSDHYRTVSSGNWNDPAIWEVSPTGLPPWSPTAYPPTHYAQSISIAPGHQVDITTNVSYDQLTVQEGATLNYSAGTQTIKDGPGVDLRVEGTFIDASNSSTVWETGATWSLGGNATYVKTNSTSSNDWRDKYQGGISNIAETATWVIRKVSATNPSVSSIDMVYPNLIIENMTAGNWNTSGTSTFQGATGTAPVVRGSLDIGGSGTGTVTFYNNNMNIEPVRVLQNVIVRVGSTLSLGGTAGTLYCQGLEVRGDVVCDGTIAFGTVGTAGDSPRRLILSGPAAQQITGAGTLNAYGLEVDKTMNDVTLGMSLSVYHRLAFSTGRILSHGTPHVITLGQNATVQGASNAGFVTGKVGKIGNSQFTFPVGKGSLLRPIAIGPGGMTTDSFVAEYLYADPDPEDDDAVFSPLHHISDCEYWTLQPIVATPNRAVTLSWDVNSCGVTDPSHLRVAYYDASATGWVNRGNTAWTGTTTSGTVTSGANSSYGTFTLASISDENPLPITLVDFHGRVQGGEGLLFWTTGSEKDNAWFEVLSATDAYLPLEKWDVVGRLPGAGTSQTPLHYSLVDDRSGKRGVHYYRLKQIDHDGTHSYSDVVALDYGHATAPVVFPNPFTHDAVLSMALTDDAEVRLTVMNAMGQEVARQAMNGGSGTFSAPLGGLVPEVRGVYFLVVENGGRNTVLRLVRE
jgi:hypothetical protein